MVKFYSVALLGLAATTVQAVPLQRRVAQTISASTAKWEQACIAAGGGQKCNPLSVAAFTTLLAAAGPCEQQDAADNMVAIGKQLNAPEVVSLAQIFVQQPRNSPNAVSIPYCQKAPQNAELNGLFQCQFVGVSKTNFAGGAGAGAPGTIPFGLTALNPAGSCPAHPDGPVPDGQQLADIVQTPGTPSGGGSGGGGGGGNDDNNDGTTTTAPPEATPSPTEDPTPSATETTAPAPTAPPAGGAGDFKLSNGQAAQGLNLKFASLTADSACSAGDIGCVGGGFAQCVGGKFVVQSCGSSLICAALPLVNSPGTSVTCTTLADAEARIAATGATGGLTGSGADTQPTAPDQPSNDDKDNSPSDGVPSDDTTPAPTTPDPTPAPAPAPTPVPAAGGFQLQNGKDAQALNAKFDALTADSPCEAGDNACVDGGFAQCVGGKFVVTQCAASLECAALPLVNKPGTSITCTTKADALDRIGRTGATGGISG